MPAPHIESATEPARLRAIQKYDLAAAFLEPLFQELTNITASIFGLPVAFLSLVDHTQVDFPATHGVLGLRTLPREAALCSLAVHHHRTVVLNHISQGSESPQWHTAQRFKMEFYVGAPVLVEQHHAVGALCLSDHQARTFTGQEEAVVEELAALVSHAVVARWQYLAAENGAPHWQAVQRQAIAEIHALGGVVRHLSAERDPLAPTPDALLHVVRRRLAALKQVFEC
jgi:GAF domain-containing protein